MEQCSASAAAPAAKCSIAPWRGYASCSPRRRVSMASELFSSGGPLAHEDPDLSDEERALAQRLAALRTIEPSEEYRRRATARLQQRIAAEPTRAAGFFW